MGKTRVRIKLRPDLKEFLKAEFGAALNEVTHQVASEIADRARSVPPRPASGGGFAASVQVEGSSVGTTHIAGHIIEFGGAHTPAYAPLRRGAEELGLEVRDDRG